MIPTDGLDVDALIVSVAGFGDGSVRASDRDLEPTWSIAHAQAVLGLDGCSSIASDCGSTGPFDLRHGLSRSVLRGWRPVMTCR